MTKSSNKPGTRSAQRKTCAQAQTDLVVTMARRAARVGVLALDNDAVAFKHGKDTPAGKSCHRWADYYLNEMRAAEDFLSTALCDSVEGAVAQIIHIYSWASYAAIGAEGADKGPLERIERMSLWVLRLLSYELKIDMEQFGSAYYLPSDGSVEAQRVRP